MAAFDAEPLGRRDRYFRRQLGSFAELEKRYLGPNGSVFGHVASRLAHEPDWRDAGRLAPAGFQERVIQDGLACRGLFRDNGIGHRAVH